MFLFGSRTVRYVNNISAAARTCVRLILSESSPSGSFRAHSLRGFKLRTAALPPPKNTIVSTLNVADKPRKYEDRDSFCLSLSFFFFFFNYF